MAAAKDRFSSSSEAMMPKRIYVAHEVWRLDKDSQYSLNTIHSNYSIKLNKAQEAGLGTRLGVLVGLNLLGVGVILAVKDYALQIE